MKRYFCLFLFALLLPGCGSRSISYGAFDYSNVGQDTAFGLLNVTRVTTTEKLDPDTGAVIERVIDQTTVKVDAYQGADAMARAVMESAAAVKEVAEKLP